MSTEEKSVNDFAREAEETPQGTFREITDFLRYNKKWWLTPIVCVMMLLGAFVVLSGTAVAPFIYSLF